MSERNADFLEIYRDYRVKDQLTYYDGRSEEFERARNQLVVMIATLTALAGLAGGLAAGNAFGQRPLWAVLAVVFPALATTLAGYDALYAFQHQAQLFQDAARSLDLARAAAPMATTADDQAVSQYVTEVETILVTEQGHWGQLISDLRLPATAATDADPSAQPQT
jgi:ABC-type transport system involved in cytochrome bd biosynthesis fused ATPase/permease subunit